MTSMTSTGDKYQTLLECPQLFSKVDSRYTIARRCLKSDSKNCILLQKVGEMDCQLSITMIMCCLVDLR